MARAILNGVNPYLPLPKLAEQWISGSGFFQLNHPTPHPPAVGLLSLPFGLLIYETSALLWLFFELLCLLASVCLILRWWEVELKPWTVIATFLFILGWGPITDDLWYGQLNSCLLLLLLCGWFALRAGSNAAGGAFIGGMVTLKLAAWPIVLFLALRRRWSGVLVSASTIFTIHLGAIIVVGSAVVKDYYFNIGPSVSSVYRGYENNFSTWTLGGRLFAEFRHNFVTLPLWSDPSLAQLLTYLVPAGFLVFGLALAMKAKQFDTSFGILVIVGILVNPIAWNHYLVLALIPIIIAVRRIGAMETPQVMAIAMFVIYIILCIPPGARVAATLLFSRQTTSNGIAVVPLWAGGITLLPAIAVLGIILILWKTDRVALPQLLQINVDEGRERVSEIAATRV